MQTAPSGWSIYHLVQPYFFAHHHFHRRKLEHLRAAGYPAWGLAIVPESLYRSHRARYEEAAASGYMKVVRVNGQRVANRALLWFLLRELLTGRRLLVHVLRCDPAPVIRLRRMPGIGARLRYVLEYEGDLPSELIYQGAFVEGERPPSEPPSALKTAYDTSLATQKHEADRADGLVLMSKEHIELWRGRLARPVNACCLPTLPDSSRFRFDVRQRDEVRCELGLEDRLVFVYTGNLVCKWQRLEAMCAVIAELRKKIPSAWFLALVRVDDLHLAEEAISRHGLKECATVKHVPSSEIGRYLSAADVGLFLRHRHPMNMVVTSGKLGEYLAAGLPVLTTGANAEVLNEYLRQTRSGAFIDDDLALDEDSLARLVELTNHFAQPDSRTELSRAAEKQFNGDNDPLGGYVPFIRNIMKL